MERNSALFDKIAAQIEETPDRWDQSLFERHTECGTNRCIAGWALHLEYGSVYDYMDNHPERAVEYVAAELLGININEADYLFYNGFEVGPERAGEVADALRAIGAGASPQEALPHDWDGLGEL